MPDGLHEHIREGLWKKNQSQPELRKHILDELKQLQSLVDGYAAALENHPHAKHENQLIYIQKFINRILYSVTKYY
jgi:hypothetical protein